MKKSAVYGLTVDQVRQELYNAFGVRQVATIYSPVNYYQVILETQPEFQVGPDDLGARVSEDVKRHDGAALGSHAISSAPSVPCRLITRASSRR